jgi:hypothetical protein
MYVKYDVLYLNQQTLFYSIVDLEQRKKKNHISRFISTNEEHIDILSSLKWYY